MRPRDAGHEVMTALVLVEYQVAMIGIASYQPHTAGPARTAFARALRLQSSIPEDVHHAAVSGNFVDLVGPGSSYPERAAADRNG